jgi:hypothetical protein
MKKYNVLSPDGFPITADGYYSTITEAGEALEKWIKNYSKQGYYSSNNGRIPLEQLALHCTLDAINMTNKEAIDKQVQDSFDFIFDELKDEFHLQTGDISPEQMQTLMKCQEDLSILLLEYVKQNLPEWMKPLFENMELD